MINHIFISFIRSLRAQINSPSFKRWTGFCEREINGDSFIEWRYSSSPPNSKQSSSRYSAASLSWSVLRIKNAKNIAKPMILQNQGLIDLIKEEKNDLLLMVEWEELMKRNHWLMMLTIFVFLNHQIQYHEQWWRMSKW